MDDDRIVCAACVHFVAHARHCAENRDRKLPGVWSFFESLVDMPQRCIWFKPKRDAADQRTGAQRYPWLMQEYRTAMDKRVASAKAVAAMGQK